MKFAQPFPVEPQESGPLFDPVRGFDLGMVLSSLVTDAIAPARIGELGLHHAGCWECDLSDDSLSWSGGVFDLFGLPRHASLNRSDILPAYAEHSRAAMERLRANAIRFGRGFTLDVELCTLSDRQSRRARLIAAPVSESGKVVRLHGLKIAI